MEKSNLVFENNWNILENSYDLEHESGNSLELIANLLDIYMN
jgi:hypothetical protein